MLINLNFLFDPKSKLTIITSPGLVTCMKKGGSVLTNLPFRLFKDGVVKIIAGTVSITKNQMITSDARFYHKSYLNKPCVVKECPDYYLDYVDKILNDQLVNKPFRLATLMLPDELEMLFIIPDSQKHLVSNGHLFNGLEAPTYELNEPHVLMPAGMIAKQIANNTNGHLNPLSKTGIYRG